MDNNKLMDLLGKYKKQVQNDIVEQLAELDNEVLLQVFHEYQEKSNDNDSIIDATCILTEIFENWEPADILMLKSERFNSYQEYTKMNIPHGVIYSASSVHELISDLEIDSMADFMMWENDSLQSEIDIVKTLEKYLDDEEIQELYPEEDWDEETLRELEEQEYYFNVLRGLE